MKSIDYESNRDYKQYGTMLTISHLFTSSFGGKFGQFMWLWLRYKDFDMKHLERLVSTKMITLTLFSRFLWYDFQHLWETT